MKLLKTIRHIEDGVEAGAVLLAGTALALALLVGVPIWLAWVLFQEGRIVLGSLVAMLFALTALGVLRDLRARQWTWLTTGLAGVWTLCTAYVLLRYIVQ